MTKKHFERIASILRHQKLITYDPDASIYTIARCLCSYFREENPRFDANRFMRACGFDQGYEE